jgi:hypothetical protein
LNAEFRKRIEELSMQPISVVIVYNIIFTLGTKTHKTMLEPTAAMYGCHTQAHPLAAETAVPPLVPLQGCQ